MERSLASDPNHTFITRSNGSNGNKKVLGGAVTDWEAEEQTIIEAVFDGWLLECRDFTVCGLKFTSIRPTI